MITLSSARTRRLSYRLGLLAAAVFCLAGNASAALIISVESVAASAGSTGNFLDVTLANTASTPVTGIGGFAFEIMAASSSITFTAVNTSTTTAPYIFAGTSVFGPNIVNPPPALPGQTLAAQDITSLPAGVAINANSSLGLGHVLFNVAPGAAPGPVAVTLLAFPNTDLSSNTGGNITLGGLIGGETTISIPEPSSLLMAGIATVCLMVVLRFRATIVFWGQGTSRPAQQP